jgi:hypothetical protein
MIHSESHTIDEELFIEPHWRLRNIFVLNDGPGQIKVYPGDDRPTHDITVPAGDGIVIYDPEAVGVILDPSEPQTSVTVSHVFSRALYTVARR